MAFLGHIKHGSIVVPYARLMTEVTRVHEHSTHALTPPASSETGFPRAGVQAAVLLAAAHDSLWGLIRPLDSGDARLADVRPGPPPGETLSSATGRLGQRQQLAIPAPVCTGRHGHSHLPHTTSSIPTIKT